jgi:cytochrome b subunit of formate dehydrogenase
MVVLAGFGVILTGFLMMFRVETIFARNPYLFSDSTWGLVYVIHGLSSVAFVGMIMAHVYFAVLPEKRWMTISMIAGWITKKDFLEHHDPERWVVTEQTKKA